VHYTPPRRPGPRLNGVGHILLRLVPRLCVLGLLLNPCLFSIDDQSIRYMMQKSLLSLREGSQGEFAASERGSGYLLLLVFCELSSLNLTVICDYVLQISRYVAI
jgi:hypothetical protein